jgi:hypothetical protein
MAIVVLVDAHAFRDKCAVGIVRASRKPAKAVVELVFVTRPRRTVTIPAWTSPTPVDTSKRKLDLGGDDEQSQVRSGVPGGDRATGPRAAALESPIPYGV